ncbi:hypothetical protein AALA90_16545 [Lachnospiraceae bacterium 38-10]
MKNKGRTLLPLTERLDLASRSRAVSPEAAAKLVQRFSDIRAQWLFFGNADVEILSGLTGKFWEHPAVDMSTYRGFCHSFRLAVNYDNDFFPPPYIPKRSDNAYEPVWGVTTNNAMVMLGLMLLDHARGQLIPRDFYHCMRMTLGQYLDALVDLSFRKDGTQDPFRSNTWQFWREVLLKDYDGSKPLAEALTDILKRYLTAWQEFHRLDHILRCTDDLSCCLENERIGDPAEADLPDPGSENVAPGVLRSQFFLSERDYRPEALRALAEKSPSAELRELLEKYISEERLAYAMREINMAVTDLYLLWVEPYLQMEEYHYERHL